MIGSLFLNLANWNFLLLLINFVTDRRRIHSSTIIMLQMFLFSKCATLNITKSVVAVLHCVVSCHTCWCSRCVEALSDHPVQLARVHNSNVIALIHTSNMGSIFWVYLPSEWKWITGYTMSRRFLYACDPRPTSSFLTSSAQVDWCPMRSAFLRWARRNASACVW